MTGVLTFSAENAIWWHKIMSIKRVSMHVKDERPRHGLREKIQKDMQCLDPHISSAAGMHAVPQMHIMAWAFMQCPKKAILQDNPCSLKRLVRQSPWRAPPRRARP